jgi:hypothetical protein
LNYLSRFSLVLQILLLSGLYHHESKTCVASGVNFQGIDFSSSSSSDSISDLSNANPNSLNNFTN